LIKFIKSVFNIYLIDFDSPAAIRTPIFEKFGIEQFNLEAIEKVSAENYPLRRIGEPIDCAKAVAYLASDDASFISGIVMPVDGAPLYSDSITPQDQ